MTRLNTVVGLLVAVLLTACAQSTVVRRYGDETPRQVVPARAVAGPGEYIVVRGDTLYGIAFRHGLDWRDVAAWNAIPAPYTIYPGQKLRLRAAGTQVAAASRPAPARPTASAPPRPSAPPVAISTPTPTPTPDATPPQAVGAGSSSPPPPRPATPAVPANGPVAWRWPAEGQLVGRFVNGDPTRQGLDIAGNGGQAVRAAADGVVVYSGAGLVGYGELVIIKHTDEWLSAYGHNRKRLVDEGQAVKAGEQIAEMGRTGASRDMLHFEIRRNGRPIDPLPLLPAR